MLLLKASLKIGHKNLSPSGTHKNPFGKKGQILNGNL